MITKRVMQNDREPDPDEKRQAGQLLSQLAKEALAMPQGTNPETLPAAVALLGASTEIQLEALRRMLVGCYYYKNLEPVLWTLMNRPLPWNEEIERLVQQTHWGILLDILERYKALGHTLSPKAVAALRKIEIGLKKQSGDEARRQQRVVVRLLGEDLETLPDAGEAWADLARTDIEALPQEQQTAWKRLFVQMQIADGSKPSTKWRKEAKVRLAVVGEDAFRQMVVRWFNGVTLPPMRTVREQFSGRTWEYQESLGSENNINLLKGLAWLCAETPGADTARALARLVETCLRKLPRVGAWAVRPAMAALWSLTESDSPEAVGQLGRLKMKVTVGVALNAIEKGLEVVAKRTGVSKTDLEDLSVPTYGCQLDGTRREVFGECAATAAFTPTGEVQVAWLGPNAKPVKSVPTAVKQEFAAELKEFKSEVAAAGKMLSAQKIRFDGFFLPERVWTYGVWRERFLVHPILAQLARQLIWQFAEPNDGRKTQGIWNEALDRLVDVQGASIDGLTETTQVRLWHPIGFPVETVVAWRNYLLAAEIVQPFKQAYREVYVLTEAERNTNTYSNRFAGHILKQHPMHALAMQRGWDMYLQMLFAESVAPAVKWFPEHSLRIEFWIEGIGDSFDDTTPAGAYLYLSTDQVRFYRMEAPANHSTMGAGYSTTQAGQVTAPTDGVPLADVPPRVFSEVMRDVDLFIGVASVGNDPVWADGGPQGRYRELAGANYWNDYAFGELSATASTRRDVLDRLLPRLKIASRCSLTERFLVVRGDLRTYKIHLGSGNILMEPNDQYLCIVQDRSLGSNATSVNFLPFEGDHRLTLILSKAFLLAEDTKITDPTITRQIRL